MSSATSATPVWATQRTVSQQTWNPSAILDISPESLRRCRGINGFRKDGSRSRGTTRQCNHKIKEKEAKEAVQILAGLAQVPPEEVLDSIRLRALAELALCTNRHRKGRCSNVDRLLARWKATITVLVAGPQAGNITRSRDMDRLTMREVHSPNIPTASRVRAIRQRAQTYLKDRYYRIRLEAARNSNDAMAAGMALQVALRRKIRVPERLLGPAIAIKNLHFNLGLFVLNSSDSDAPWLLAFKEVLKTSAVRMWNWGVVRAGLAPVEVATTE